MDDDAPQTVLCDSGREQALTRLGLNGLASPDIAERGIGVLRLDQLLKGRYDAGWEEGDYNGWRRGRDQSMWIWACVGFVFGITLTVLGFALLKLPP